MKYQNAIKPNHTSDLTFDGMYYETTADDWRARAERLQARRWHLLQQAAHERRLLRVHEGGIV